MWSGGNQLVWSYSEADRWQPVRVVQFPGFVALFDRLAPFDLRPFVPPFLIALGDTGIVQVWTGLLARSAPGWHLLVRPPANMARSKAYELFEAILRTDELLSPVFLKIRMLRPDAPIEFDADLPVAQIQTVQTALVESKLEDFKVVDGLQRFSSMDWLDFRNAVVEGSDCAPKELPTSTAAVRNSSSGKSTTGNRNS